MKFLVILICLMVNYLWLKDFERFDDGCLFRFRCRLEGLTSNLAEKVSLGWLERSQAIWLSVLALITVVAL